MPMDLSFVEMTALLVAALVVGVSKAGFGSGVGIMAVPLMAVAIGADRMLGVLLPVLVVGDMFAVVHYVRTRDGRNLLVLLSGCAGGVACGAVVLGWFRAQGGGERLLDGSVGGLCILFVVARVWLTSRRARKEAAGSAETESDAAPSPAPSPKAYRPAAWHGVLAGLAAGLTSTLAHAAGPMVAMFLLSQRMGKRVFVGTSAWFFLGCNMMKIPVYLLGNRPVITGDTLAFLPYLAPMVVVGTLLGAWMNRRIPARAFSVAVYLLVLATGAKLVWGALA